MHSRFHNAAFNKFESFQQFRTLDVDFTNWRNNLMRRPVAGGLVVVCRNLKRAISFTSLVLFSKLIAGYDYSSCLISYCLRDTFWCTYELGAKLQ